jgi:hypothetical protein
MPIIFMRYRPVRSDPFYLVGTDAASMLKTAKAADATVSAGEPVSYERVLDAADTPVKARILEHGIEASKAGRTTDYYLFCC